MDKEEVFQLLARKRRDPKVEDKAAMRRRLERDMAAAMAKGVKVTKVEANARYLTQDSMGTRDFIRFHFTD